MKNAGRSSAFSVKLYKYLFRAWGAGFFQAITYQKYVTIKIQGVYTMKENTIPYSPAERNLYLTGLAGQNILYAVITASLGYYLQFTLCIPAFWAGAILSTARIFDALKDPFIGAWMTKRNRSFRAFLLCLPLPTALLTVLCFSNGIYDENQNSTVQNGCIIAAAFLSYILWETVFTMSDIPITGYPARMTADKTERVKLMALRPIGGLAASVCTLIVQPLAFFLSNRFGGTGSAEQKGFLTAAGIFSVLGGILFQCTAVHSRERVRGGTASDKNAFSYFLSNPLLRKVLLSGILGSLKSMPAVVLAPLVSYYFASKDPMLSFVYTALLGGGSFIGMLVSTRLIPKLARKYANQTIFVKSNLWNIAPNILLFILYCLFPKRMTEPVFLALLFCLMTASGICTSVSGTVQTLLISDAVDLEQRRSGARPDAVFFSGQTFIVKISTGISSLAAGLVYMLIHFSSAETQAINQLIAAGGIPREAPEYSALMTALFFLLTVPPALSCAGSAWVFTKSTDAATAFLSL